MDYAPSEDEKDHDVRMNEPEDEQMHQDLLEDVDMFDASGDHISSIRFEWSESQSKNDFKVVELCGGIQLEVWLRSWIHAWS